MQRHSMKIIVILAMALGVAGCGYCKPGVGGNVPGGKTSMYCTNEAGGRP